MSHLPVLFQENLIRNIPLIYIFTLVFIFIVYSGCFRCKASEFVEVKEYSFSVQFSMKHYLTCWNQNSVTFSFVCTMSVFKTFTKSGRDYQTKFKVIKKCYLLRFFFSTGTHSMQSWTTTTRHGVTRKRSTKRVKHTGNLFRKNLQLKGVCQF